MNTPFRPDRTNADELNALLDAMRSGTPTPDRSSEETVELGHIARQFRGLADHAASATPAPAKTFDAIWEDMMSAHTITAPTPVATGPATPLDDSTHRVRPMPEGPRTSRLQSLVSAAILAILLTGMIAAAWNLRDGGNGGGSDPGDDVRLAAPGVDIGTPEASPAADIDWTAWITPEECSAEPMSQDEYTSILSNPPDVSHRSYTVAGPADPESSEDAAESARIWRACSEYRMENQRRGMETDAFIRTWKTNESEPQPEFREQQIEQGKQLSAQLDTLTAADFLVVTTADPPEELRARWERNTTSPGPYQVRSIVYNPEKVFMLSDGRALVPETDLVWSSDPERTGMLQPPSTTSQNTFVTVTGQVLILANEDGTWKIDNLLYVCLGECDFFWQSIEPATTTAANAEAQETSSTTPDASPQTSSDKWWTWPRAEECPEPVDDHRSTDDDTDEARSWDTNDYLPFTQPSKQDAEAVARVARALEACKQVGGPVSQLQTDRARRGDPLGEQDYRANYYRLSREVSDAFPITDPSAFVRTTAEKQPHATPGSIMRRTGLVPEPQSWVFIPDQTVQLPDGRVGIPASVLVTEGTEEAETRLKSLEHGSTVNGLLLFANVDGEWLYDGELTLCIGNCNWFWEQMMPEPTPVASSFATPEGTEYPST